MVNSVMEVKAAHMERSAEAGKVTTTFDEEGNDTTAPTVRELGEENEGGGREKVEDGIRRTRG